jgi:hypothetical protein
MSSYSATSSSNSRNSQSSNCGLAASVTSCSLEFAFQAWGCPLLVRGTRVTGSHCARVDPFLMKVPLCRASLARRVTIIPAAPNSCCSPQFPWVRISLKMFLLHHATVARRDTFLQAATQIPWDPQSPRVGFFGVTLLPAAICRSLCRFFVIPEDFTAAASVRTI